MKIDYDFINDKICGFFRENFFQIICWCVLLLTLLFVFPARSYTYPVTVKVVDYETAITFRGTVHDYVVVSYDNEIYRVENTKFYSNSSIGQMVDVSFVVQKNIFDVIVRKYVDYSPYGKEF